MINIVTFIIIKIGVPLPKYNVFASTGDPSETNTIKHIVSNPKKIERNAKKVQKMIEI
ncbi:hypothetical protein LEQ41_05780 [Streptococcus agalactiae]|nr:hypothetical protein [Streptococcus agalactiae]